MNKKMHEDARKRQDEFQTSVKEQTKRSNEVLALRGDAPSPRWKANFYIAALLS